MRLWLYFADLPSGGRRCSLRRMLTGSADQRYFLLSNDTLILESFTRSRCRLPVKSNAAVRRGRKQKRRPVLHSMKRGCLAIKSGSSTLSLAQNCPRPVYSCTDKSTEFRNPTVRRGLEQSGIKHIHIPCGMCRIDVVGQTHDPDQKYVFGGNSPGFRSTQGSKDDSTGIFRDGVRIMLNRRHFDLHGGHPAPGYGLQTS